MNISIPTPCHENWDTMQPELQGKFCNACSKIVVDFTNMSVPEISNYLISKKSEKVCGRFHNHQLKVSYSTETKVIDYWQSVFSTGWQLTKKWAIAIALLFFLNNNTEAQTMGAPVAAKGAVPKPQYPPDVVGEISIAPPVKDCTKTGAALTNKKRPVNKYAKRPKQKNPDKATPILMGKIRVK